MTGQQAQRRGRLVRHDPITQRAAARVVQLVKSGRIPVHEQDALIRLLSAFDPTSGGEWPTLRRAALRLAALGLGRGPRVSSFRRRSTALYGDHGVRMRRSYSAACLSLAA